MWFFIGLGIFAILVGLMPIKVFAQHGRAVIFQLGRYKGVKGPGILFILPFIYRAIKVDMREVAIDVPLQKAITRDNVAVAAKATIKFKVIDPLAAATKVLDIVQATAKVSNESLRNLLTQSEHEQLYNPGNASNILQKYINKEIENWGLEVTEAKLENIHLGKSTKDNT